MKTKIVVALVIAIGGLGFSAYLTFREIFASGRASTTSCGPLDEPGTMVGAPTCIYGFAIYLVIGFAVAITLLAKRVRG